MGVIVGNDLKYKASADSLDTEITATYDKEMKKDRKNFDTYVRNIYRVLMSRGMKGCYIYCVDKEVADYFRRRLMLKD